MSEPLGGNPYAAPSPESYPDKLAAAPGAPWQMNYLGAFEMIHRNPDWLVTTLLMSLCLLSGIIIPAIGTIVVSGYMYESVEILHRTNGNYYPKFDFNRFVEYLVRGVGPFLINLVLGIILAAIVLVGYGAIIGTAVAAGAGAGKGNDAAVGISVLGALAVVMPLIFVASFAISFLSVPLGLRGGVSGDIGQSFNFGWAIDFIKKTWLEMILVFLFQFALGIMLEIAVLATCGLGAFVVLGYVFLISAWLQYQLYRVYLSRGGEPIPFKPTPLPMPVQ